MIVFDFHQPVYGIAIVTEDKFTLNLSWVNTCCRAPSPSKHMQGYNHLPPHQIKTPNLRTGVGAHWEEVTLD